MSESLAQLCGETQTLFAQADLSDGLASLHLRLQGAGPGDQ